MASGGSERLYEEDDVLDERLLNQISKWIMYNRLPSLARHLGFSDAEITRIMFASRDPEEQCFQVCTLDLNRLSKERKLKDYETLKKNNLIFLFPLLNLFYTLQHLLHMRVFHMFAYVGSFTCKNKNLSQLNSYLLEFGKL